MMDMLKIDGSYGEGGGSIVRLAVALSNITEKAVNITNIRVKRDNPGLAVQHKKAIETIAKINGGTLSNIEVGSTELTYHPKSGKKRVKPEHSYYKIVLETAANIPLFLQAVILSTIFNERNVQLKIEGGGTHGLWSPTFDYFEHVTLNVLKKLNYRVETRINKYGFYPKGGARVTVNIVPLKTHLKITKKFRTDLNKAPSKIKVFSIASSNLKQANVAERQIKGAKRFLKRSELTIEEYFEYVDTLSTGTSVTCVTNDFPKGGSKLGKRGVPAEKIGKIAAENLFKSLNTSYQMDEYLLDQLLPYLALSDEQISVTASVISQHTKTNMWLIKKFFPDKELEYENNTVFIN